MSVDGPAVKLVSSTLGDYICIHDSGSRHMAYSLAGSILGRDMTLPYEAYIPSLTPCLDGFGKVP